MAENEVVLEVGEQQLAQSRDEIEPKIHNTETASSKPLFRNSKIQIDDGHDVTNHEHVNNGIWPFVHRKCLFYLRRGLLLAICSALCFSIRALFLKGLTKTVDPFQTIVMIMPFLIVGPLVYLIYKRISLPRDYVLHLWLLLGGVSLSSYLTLYTLSLSKMDVADVVTIEFTSLVFVGFLSWVILKETPSVFYVGFSVISFLGVVFISRPPFLFGSQISNNDFRDLLIGSAFALGAAFSVALLYNVVRKQTKLGIHTAVSIFSNAVIVVITNVVVCTVTKNWRRPSTLECLYAAGAGLSYFFAKVALYLALKCETATFVNITLTLEILLTFLFQFAFLQIQPFWTSYVGAILVIAACIGMTLTAKRQITENDLDNTM
ncbi:Solute carrier family 35 member G1 [Holothuria leucospilota]|uniref:Solute carrier family 35 member G1 n=1 Tax=Holothuria leucospilota TaxID=206669 RepID=A0A9Q1H701_HOLLE|nr:Solute carrier family 35 member G1 [Holothuria leucospilota]